MLKVIITPVRGGKFISTCICSTISFGSLKLFISDTLQNLFFFFFWALSLFFSTHPSSTFGLLPNMKVLVEAKNSHVQDGEGDVDANLRFWRLVFLIIEEPSMAKSLGLSMRTQSSGCWPLNTLLFDWDLLSHCP